MSRRAENQLGVICRRIARDNPVAAAGVDARVRRWIEALATTPSIGKARPEARDQRLRFSAVGQLVVVFQIEHGKLVVKQIVHGSRDFNALFG